MNQLVAGESSDGQDGSIERLEASRQNQFRHEFSCCRSHHQSMPTESRRNIQMIRKLIDDPIVIGSHLVQPAPSKYQFQIAKFGYPALKNGHEIIAKSLDIATEAEPRWLLRIGFGDDDLVVRRTSPMHPAGIDHNRKFVGPRPRQFASKELLDWFDRHVDAERGRQTSRIS